MPIKILKRPSDEKRPWWGKIIKNSFCNGELDITDEDKEFFRKCRKLTEVKEKKDKKQE